MDLLVGLTQLSQGVSRISRSQLIKDQASTLPVVPRDHARPRSAFGAITVPPPASVPLQQFVGHPAYGTRELRADLER